MVFFGKISKTRGNRGEVLLERGSSCPEPDFENNSPVILKSEKYQIKNKIEYIRKIKDTFVLKFKGIDSIGEAFKLVGYSLFSLEVRNTPESKNDWFDFIVRDIQNNSWGKVRGIQNNGLNQVMEIESTDGIIYIPLCEEIIREINTGQKLIIIDPPDGLRKLNK